MKLIKPSFEILESQGSLKDIERAARTCYQSQDKISKDDSSAKTLVANLIKRKHFAMLEFGENINVFIDFIDLPKLLLYISNKSYFAGMTFINVSMDGVCFSSNIRAAFEFINEYKESLYAIERYETYEKSWGVLAKLYNSFLYLLPEEIINDSLQLIKLPDKQQFYNKYSCNINEDRIKDIIPITVKFICDRGVSHELIRMRFDTSMINEDSYAQKSTRYCDEKGDIEFIEPCWDYNIPTCEIFDNKFVRYLWQDEANYKELRACNWKPEQARAILPNALATEIVVKTSLKEWKHIFELRCDKAAHPQMRELMIPLREEFINRKYI